MVHHRQQRVRVRWQVDADDLGLLVHRQIDEAGILVRKAVVVLPPDVRRQQVIQRRHRPSPADLLAALQPFGVLVEHRIDDVHEGFVRREHTVTTREQIALQPTLQGGLAQDLHDTALRTLVLVCWQSSRHPHAVAHGEHRSQTVGLELVWGQDAEVAPVRIERHRIAQERAQNTRGLRGTYGRLGHRHRICLKIWQPELLHQQAPVGVRIRAHAARSARR